MVLSWRPHKYTVRNMIVVSVYLTGYYGNTKGRNGVTQGWETVVCWAKRRDYPLVYRWFWADPAEMTHSSSPCIEVQSCIHHLPPPLTFAVTLSSSFEPTFLPYRSSLSCPYITRSFSSRRVLRWSSFSTTVPFFWQTTFQNQATL